MTRREFEGWQAFDMLYPIGQQGDIAAAAFKDAMLFNARYGTKEHPKPIDNWRNLIPRYLLKEEQEESEAERAKSKETELRMYLMGLSAHEWDKGQMVKQ